MTVPLILGLAFGRISPGLVGAMGALNVAFSDGSDPYQQRLRRMLMASLICGLGVFIGSATGNNAAAAVIIAGCWAFAAGMMVALGTTPGDLGTVSLVVVVVFASQPMDPRNALLSGLVAVAGGAFQTLLSVASWFVRPYEPVRRALGQLYGGLKKMIDAHVDASASPPATSQSNEASKALAALTRDYSLESERYQSLFTQAERARLSILAIKRLRARMRRELVEETPEILDRVLDMAAHVCSEVTRLLLRDVESIHVDRELNLLQALVNSIRDDGNAAAAAMSRDARFQAAALAGQLRAAVSLAGHSVGAGRREFERQEARKPWSLRLTGSLATLRANLSLQSPAFRHAVRLACCVAFGIAVGRGLGLVRPYWIPMTIAIVLKPDFTTTFSRGVLRLAGTYSGLGLATGLFHVISPTRGEQIALIAVFTYVLRALGPANYGILTAAVSAFVVLLIALTGVSPQQVIIARAINTTLGGLLALIAYVVWPTWERTQLDEAMAVLLEAYRKYFCALAKAHLGSAESFQSLESGRMEGRLARTNVEASVERYRAEPGASPERLDRMASMLASSHRFAHAAMSLEADMLANSSRTAPQAFRRFFDDVERTLELLAEALRGAQVAASDFPDLRAAHTRLLEAGGSSYTLLATETDRIANSLNTLREQIL